jgi:hypothetical protein
LAIILVCLAVPPRAFAQDQRLNVVLIVADDLGWADLGCYGSRYHHTPSLDRLNAPKSRL